MNLSLKAVVGAAVLMFATEHAAFAQSPATRQNLRDVRQVLRAAPSRPQPTYRPAPTSRPLPTYRSQPTYRTQPVYRPTPTTSRPGSSRMSSGFPYSRYQSPARLFPTTRARR
jgi:hypothetical protein